MLTIKYILKYLVCALTLTSVSVWGKTELPVLPATIAVQGLSLHIDPQQSVYDENKGFSGAGTMFFPALGRELPVVYTNVRLDNNAQLLTGQVKARITPDLLKASAIGDLEHPNFVNNFDGLKYFIKAARTHTDEMPLMLNTLPSFQNANFGTLVVMMTEINVSNEGATASMMALERMPEGIYLPFTRKDMAFDPLSMQPFKTTELALTATAEVADVQLPITFLAGDATGSKGTYVSFDCNGIKAFRIEGFHKFTSGIVTPSPASAPPVVASFVAEVKSLRQFVVKVTIPKFTVFGIEDVAFEILDAEIDYSDSENALTFPEAYFKEMGNTAPTKRETWKGIYIGKLGISLPTLPMRDKEGKSFEFGSKDMIYDKGNGFSATLYAKPAGFADINIKGFRLTLDEFNFTLKKNSVQNLNFLGGLAIPVLLDEKGSLQYKATFNTTKDANQPKFQVGVQFTKDLELQVPLLELAGCKLQKTSVVQIFNKNDKWGVFANLQGNFNIGLKKESIVSLGLPFEGWKIGDDPSVQTPSGAEELPMNFKAFDLNGGDNSSAPPKKMSGFPLSVDNITFKTEKGVYIFGMEIAVALGGGSSSFQAKGGVDISAGLQFSKLISKKPWEGIEFKDVTLKTLQLNADMSAFNFAGRLDLMKNDPVYGNGFRAKVDLTVKVGKKFTLAAEAIFGNKSDYSYFYVDANVAIPPTPLVGPLTLHGFGGGIYFNMEQTLSADGKSNKYIPKKETFGFMARVEVGLANRATFDAVGELQFQFRGNWELDFFKINVKAGLLNDVASISPSALQPFSGSKVVGSCTMMYDNRNQTITVNASVKLQNLQVSGEGQLNMFFDLNDRSNWYVHLGTAERPVYVQFAGLGVTMYLMLGKGIGELPSIEARVPKLAGMGLEVKSNQRNDPSSKNSLSTTGSGFAFGISYRLDQDFSFLMFSGNVNAGFGVDALLRDDLGECNGQKMGWNGWYMAGQAYAYVGARVDLDVNLLFIKGKFNIATLQVAAVLEANLPTPKLLRGRVAARYSILGGLVKGKFGFGFELKEDNPCNVVAYPRSPAVGQPLVAATYPDKKEEIQVFDDIIVSTNLAVRGVQSYDFQGRTYYYKVRLTKVNIMDGTKKLASIETDDVTYKDDYTFLLTPRMALPANTNLTLEIAAEAYDTDMQGGTLKTVGSEKRTVEFKTGPRPKKVYPQMVSYSAPGADQKYWYKGYAKPKVTLKQNGYEYLFDPNHEGIPSEYKWLLYKKEGQDSTVVGTYDLTATFDGTEVLTLKGENGARCGYSERTETQYVESFSERAQCNCSFKTVTTRVPLICTYQERVPSRSFSFDKLNELDLEKKASYRIEVIRQPKQGQQKTTATTTVSTTNAVAPTDTENEASIETRGLSVSKGNEQEIAILYTNQFSISQVNDVAEKIKINPANVKVERPNSLGQPDVTAVDNLEDNLPKARSYRPYLTLEGSVEPLDIYDNQRIAANSSIDNAAGSEFFNSLSSTQTQLMNLTGTEWGMVKSWFGSHTFNAILGKNQWYVDKLMDASHKNFVRASDTGAELVFNSVNVQCAISDFIKASNTSFFQFLVIDNPNANSLNIAQVKMPYIWKNYENDKFKAVVQLHFGDYDKKYRPESYSLRGTLNYTTPTTVPDRFTDRVSGNKKAFTYSFTPPAR